MDRYGRDYGGGRWRGRTGFQGYDEDFSAGYAGYAGSPGYRTPSTRRGRGSQPDNQRGWDEFGEGHDRWGSRDDVRHGFSRGESGRTDRDGWGQRQPRWLRPGYDDDFGSGTSRYGYQVGGRYFRGRQDEYDRDFMDRVRRGWNNFRDDARGWLHRGYDRGW